MYLRFCCRLSADRLTKSIDFEFVLLAKNSLFLYMMGKIIIPEFTTRTPLVHFAHNISRLFIYFTTGSTIFTNSYKGIYSFYITLF